MKTIITWFVALLVVIPFLHGQQPNRLSGKIIDAETGSPVVSATIIVNASGKGFKSDVDGTFFLPAEKGKTVTLKISSVGYAEKIITDIKLEAYTSSTLVISLARSNSQLEAVVVKAGGRKESVSSLYNIQKNSSAISDGISADIIRKSPDRNTGDVLKRVSGSSVQDNKFVVIRGLSERYNVSMLNNSVLPSTEPDKKAFSFDIIPSSLVDNLVIYKSPTPDLPGDFAGGAIKISTKDFPSRRVSEFSLNVGFNSLTTFRNFYKSYPNGSLDFLGFFDNSRLIPGPYYRHRGADFINFDPNFKKEVTKMFPNTYGSEAAYKSMPSISVGYTGGNTKIYNNGNKLGYIYSLNYAAGRRVSDRLRDEYAIDKLQQYEYNTMNYDEKNNISALLNLTYSYGKNKISLKNVFNNDFTKTAALRNGFDISNTPDKFYYKSSNSEAMNNGIVNSVLEGTHNLGKQYTIDWNASYGFTYRNQPDQRILTFRTPLNQESGYYLKLSNENSPQIRDAGRVYSFLQESIYGGNVNVVRNFSMFGENQKLKIGTANYYRTRNMMVEALGYASLGAYGTTINESKEISFETIFAPENIDKYNLTIANIGTNTTDYDAAGLLNSAYLMFDNKLADRLKMTWGVRGENYVQTLNAKAQPELKRSNFDFLPSVLLTYSLSNRINIRAAASQSVNRPEFRELAAYSVYDYDNYFVVKGNPDLQRSKNTNADLRFEYFPKAGEIISASAFYKAFDNPIEQVNQGNDVLSYANADKGTVYGAEVEIRKKLDFCNSGLFSNLTFSSNVAYMKGSVKFGNIESNSPLQGQSPYLINAGLSYASKNDGFSANILYNRIGPRLRFRAVGGNALNIFERPRDVVDLQISKRLFNNKLELKATVNDLLAQSFSWYYKYDANATNTNYKPGDDRIITSAKVGTTTVLGLKYNF
ncbi:MAG TPA: TonB-dependent receptor [Flavitalea sp.]|nr:TonB-dependent receptor [Flavitalea sp.]